MSDRAVLGLAKVSLTPEQRASLVFSAGFQMTAKQIPPLSAEPATAVDIKRAMARLLALSRQPPTHHPAAKRPVDAVYRPEQLCAVTLPVRAKRLSPATNPSHRADQGGDGPAPRRKPARRFRKQGEGQALSARAAKQPDLSLTPRGLSRDLAASYIGVGVTLFDEMVEDGRMPSPKTINSRRVWDRNALDSAFGALPEEGGASATDCDDNWSRACV